MERSVAKTAVHPLNAHQPITYPTLAASGASPDTVPLYAGPSSDQTDTPSPDIKLVVGPYQQEGQGPRRLLTERWRHVRGSRVAWAHAPLRMAAAALAIETQDGTAPAPEARHAMEKVVVARVVGAPWHPRRRARDAP